MMLILFHKSIPLLAVCLLALSFTIITSDVYGQETVSITTPISPITILFDEFISLLDTSVTGNLTSVSVTANLPCDSSDNPLVTIVAGILGDTVNIIDSSSDFIGNGPRDTCVFRDNITNVTATNIPAINSIFLNHTGSSPVHIPQGVMVTLSGVFENQTSESGAPSPSLTFSEDFSGYSTQAEADASWPTIDTTKARVNPTNDNTDFDFDTASTSYGITHDTDTVLSDTWVLRGHFNFSTITNGAGGPFLFFGMSNNASGDSLTAQDFIGISIQADTSTKQYGAKKNDGTAFVTDLIGSPTQSYTFLTATDYYVEIIRTSSTAFTVEVFTNADYSTGSLGKLTGVSTSSIVGLDNIVISNRNSVLTGTIIGTFDDVLLWDGVTSVP